MPNDHPDFYLASSEGYELEAPHRCWRLKRLKTAKRDDLLLVKIEPPLVGQKYGLGGRDIEMVVLAPRHVGTTLFPINEWPTSVHVAYLLDDALHQEIINEDEIKLIAWAELYQTAEAAKFKTA